MRLSLQLTASEVKEVVPGQRVAQARQVAPEAVVVGAARGEHLQEALAAVSDSQLLYQVFFYLWLHSN
jgi:hypothetical protein